MKKIKKSFWRAYWKLHDKKKMLVARLKGYLDGLPPKTRTVSYTHLTLPTKA